MIQRMSDQHKISFLETKSEEAPVKKEATPEKTLSQIAAEQRSKKLNNKDNGLMTTHHISSARTGVITDKGGPSKQIKTETGNSVWDSNKTARLAEALDSKTKTQQEKAQIADNRRVAEQQRMNDLAESLRQTDQSKASSVSRLSDQQGTNYKKPATGFSIFDTQDFQRLAEKSEGEALSERKAQERSVKDESWKTSGKAVSSKDVMNRLFDNVFDTGD